MLGGAYSYPFSVRVLKIVDFTMLIHSHSNLLFKVFKVVFIQNERILPFITVIFTKYFLDRPVQYHVLINRIILLGFYELINLMESCIFWCYKCCSVF